MCGIIASVRPRQDCPCCRYQNAGLGQATASKACGLPSDADLLQSELNDSLDRIAHRGPDGRGVWTNKDASVGLGHARLSINDLSERGSQPIPSPDGHIHAVVNGEIYDHSRLRETFAAHGYHFRGRSDSEVVVALYAIFGAPRFLDHLRGEFALILFDDREGKVIAARDRFGIKPLYWTRTGQGANQRILLSSEAKGFLPMGWEPAWNVGAIVDSGSQHDDRTLFRGVSKVPPAHWVEVLPCGRVKKHRYWDMSFKDKHAVETRSVGEMITGVRQRLVEAIRLRLQADVPVGIYLSGGLDSSLVAGIVTHLMRQEDVRAGTQQATDKVRCFTIEFPNASGYNESDIAARTARWLGVDLIKQRMDEKVLADNFSDAAYHCERHNFDLNSVGRHVLSSAPRRDGVKVVLTGEGSDELFAGYPVFPADFLREPDLSMPESPLAQDTELREALREEVERGFAAFAPTVGLFAHVTQTKQQQQSLNGTVVPGFMRAWQPELAMFEPWVRRRWRSSASSGNTKVLERSVPAKALERIRHSWHPLHASLYLFNRGILPSVFLFAESDSPDMAHGIEARPPLLDHVLAEYADGLPPSLKIGHTPYRKTKKEAPASRSGNLHVHPRGADGPWAEDRGRVGEVLTEKWILREAARPFVMQEMYERKKHPYTAPVSYPAGGPMHAMFEGLLTREAVGALGFVDHRVVETALEQAFGPGADPKSFRTLLFVGAWVVIGRRFSVARATEQCWAGVGMGAGGK